MTVDPGILLPRCDVLLVTATDRETEALKSEIAEVSSAEPQPLHGRRQTYVDHGLVAGARVLRVRTEMGSGTSGGSGSTVADAIMEVAPRAIIMVGIAFGAKAKKKQRIGTVLISRQLQDYELQRVGTTENGRRSLIPRGDRVSASPRLIDRLRYAAESWSEHPVEFGLVLSGEKLIDERGFLGTLRELFPEAIGGEMEGRGLYVEAKDRAEWIVVKAVCDWADGDKRKNKAGNQKKAAKAAARLVVHALRLGGFGYGSVTLASTGEVLAEAERHGIDLKEYLRTLLAEVDHLDIKGISTSIRAAMREPIENLYTPLHSEVNFVGDAELVLLMRGEQDEVFFLPELLACHRRLLLVGKPGSGKSTFLHLVACMLARDIREPRPSDVVSWREEYLGLARDKPPRIPALIRLGEIVHDLLGRDPKARLPNDHDWLLRRLAERTRPAGVVDDRGLEARQQQWARWLADDKAILLLDGLDEVADLALRDRVLAIVRSACESWPKCQVVVTSRPILVEAMTAAPLCFHQAEIADFTPVQVRRFVEQWSKALYNRQECLSAENTRSLVAALSGSPELQDLACNPVMLTCLCVILYYE